MIFNNEQDYTVIAIYMINWIYMINSSEQDCISILVLMQSQSLYWTEKIFSLLSSETLSCILKLTKRYSTVGPRGPVRRGGPLGSGVAPLAHMSNGLLFDSGGLSCFPGGDAARGVHCCVGPGGPNGKSLNIKWTMWLISKYKFRGCRWLGPSNWWVPAPMHDSSGVGGKLDDWMVWK